MTTAKLVNLTTTSAVEEEADQRMKTGKLVNALVASTCHHIRLRCKVAVGATTRFIWIIPIPIHTIYHFGSID
eukprot:scaffold42248_cov321-Skeletonema_marinoi.AAC.1